MEKTTLDEFRLQELRQFPQATGELSSLLREIGIAAKQINSALRQAGFGKLNAALGLKNSSGDSIKNLDQIAHDKFSQVLRNSHSCAGLLSEEASDIIVFTDEKNCNSRYVVALDPLDGSGNINNCNSVGTVFGIYRRTTGAGVVCHKHDFLQAGLQQVAAGYIIYGSSTMLVYATKRGVNGFTLEPNIGEFCLTHPNIQCPPKGKVYSLNHSNLFQYPEPVVKYVTDMQNWNALNPDSYSSRYVGTMVADLHRTLMEGGLFMSPATSEKKQGKLRLLYECNPFAFLFEIANGAASNGCQRITLLQPEKLHQCSPIFIGSKEMVREVERYIGKYFGKAVSHLPPW